MEKLTRYDFSVEQSKNFLWLYCITLGKIIAIHNDCVEYLHKENYTAYNDQTQEDEECEGSYITDYDELDWWQKDEFLAHNWELHQDTDMVEFLEDESLFAEIPESFRSNDYTKYMTDKELSAYLGDEPKIEEPLDVDFWKADHEGWAA